MRSLLLGLGCAGLLVVASLSACSSDGSADDSDGSSGNNSSGASGSNGTSGTSGNPANPDGAPAPKFVDITPHTMQFNGSTRHYLLGKPKNFDAQKSYPLVMNFHGNPSTEVVEADILPFDRASKEEAVLVYPRALNEAGGGSYDWDLQISDDNVDMDWIVALADEIKKTVNIDKERIFGFGYSGGSFFLTQMTCRSGGFFKAISANAGGSPFVPDGDPFPRRGNGCLICPGGPIATIVTHGADDVEVGQQGGIETATCISETNACENQRSASTPTPCEIYDGCPGGQGVKLCNVPGLGHGPWASAMAESWNFFKALP